MADQLTRICAWCDDARERSIQARERGETVSHTICVKCRAKFEAGEGAAFRPQLARPLNVYGDTRCN